MRPQLLLSKSQDQYFPSLKGNEKIAALFKWKHNFLACFVCQGAFSIFTEHYKKGGG